ncbi:MAG: addiction module protein [Fibrobacterota bacterium]
MSLGLKECRARALKLNPKERASLAEQLIASLDTLDTDENERLWLEEADRRYKQYKQQGIPARSSKDVLRDARLAIQ